MRAFTLESPKDGRIVIPARVRSRSEFFLVKISGNSLKIKPVQEPRGQRIARNIWETGDGLHIQA